MLHSAPLPAAAAAAAAAAVAPAVLLLLLLLLLLRPRGCCLVPEVQGKIIILLIYMSGRGWLLSLLGFMK